MLVRHLTREASNEMCIDQIRACAPDKILCCPETST
jgi:hypothetical protein